ncbi:hypothetical protein HaLaN_06292 [Haematococcus lacustris]|uniref:Uncharacterized protein n=1 Tax=Haematococcus lacustris TaxID=44745 RepID=A0A699Z614_HAELA|nr:hypothetical protein HaLaN_06292 [Haematococcus lacustris]
MVPASCCPAQSAVGFAAIKCKPPARWSGPGGAGDMLQSSIPEQDDSMLAERAGAGLHQLRTFHPCQCGVQCAKTAGHTTVGGGATSSDEDFLQHSTTVAYVNNGIRHSQHLLHSRTASLHPDTTS